MLFLLAAGLTLVFGVMDMINLAHGSLYMVGAFLAAWLVALTGSFVVGVVGAVALTAVFGMALEAGLLRTLYARDHLSQVLATFALILILNDGVKMIFGNDLPLSAPAALAGPVELLPGLQYPAYRLLILGVGVALALLLWLLVQKTRMGALVRAGASNRAMATAMGTDIPRLFTIVFGIGAALCAVAGALLGPLLGGAGRHGREHPHPRLRRHRHRRHRIDPGCARRRDPRRRDRHPRPDAAAAHPARVPAAAVGERRRPGDRLDRGLRLHGDRAGDQAARPVPGAHLMAARNPSLRSA
jgi:hypothetical protein